VLLERIIQSARPGRFASAIRGLKGSDLEKAQILRPCPSVFNTFPGLLPFMLEHVVAVRGEVRAPGLYPVADATPMVSIVSVAGGVTRDADLERVEMLHFAAGEIAAGARTIDLTQQQTAEQVGVEPGDSLRFNAVFSDRDTGPVLLSGEFIRPGLYNIRRGERLSQVIERAGGLTPQSYPYGAVFQRESVKRAQRVAFIRTARELNSAAIFAAGRKGVGAGSLAALRELTQEIASAEPIGRVVIDADPTVLQVRRELDVVLEPGDRLHMPKRPASVLVIGDVLNPGALQFVAGTKVRDYIRQAGGFQQSADSDRTFLIYPNGVAQPVAISPWNYNPVMVPPGSTIMVPKDAAPLDIFAFAKDMTALISQMAITAASLAVISDN
jgi:protein involved in polysaccharide export with SLBB domain